MPASVCLSCRRTHARRAGTAPRPPLRRTPRPAGTAPFEGGDLRFHGNRFAWLGSGNASGVRSGSSGRGGSTGTDTGSSTDLPHAPGVSLLYLGQNEHQATPPSTTT